MALISYPARLAVLVAEAPDRPAATCGAVTLSRAQLEERADTFARHLRSVGVGEGDMVTMALPNAPEWFVATIACWKLGAIPQPVSPRLPARELTAIVELANPPVVLGTASTEGAGDRPLLEVAEWLAAHPNPSDETDPLPDVVSKAWKAPTSGGSTGRPKLIVSGDPASMDPDLGAMLGHSRDGVLVMPGPLYHNGPLIWSCHGLLHGNHVVVLPKFDATETLEAIQRYQADIIYLVPTMMKRIWRLPTEERESYDMSSLRIVWHLAEPCPEWLKQAWIDWLGPEKIVELYGGTEGQLACVISGVEWLEHRGSVGRPMTGEIMICDE
ncbi:MAG: AMP-binding protein, partial [Actinobacteria bacterium]|nr:AMP-binding protein [Actinomycetota bacterium]